MEPIKFAIRRLTAFCLLCLRTITRKTVFCTKICPMTATGSKDIKMALNGPVFFLVQEHAKSIVAIQALQSRMAVLENLQERLMRAIDDVHQHLTPSGHGKNPPTVPTSPTAIDGKSYANVASAFDKRLRFAETEITTYSRGACAGSKADSSKSDSLNKDSGIGASENSFDHSDKNADEDDELLKLLDLIDQKSVNLIKQVEGSADQEDTKRASEMSDSPSALLLDNLLYEKVDAQRQLSEVRAERDELKQRLAKLELATNAVNKEKMKVQKQLHLTLQENQNLQDRIQKSGDFKLKSESLGYMEDIEKANMKRKYLQFSEKSRMKVSTILKENNVLELQKQLLTYVMENDVLRAKLEQDGPSRLANWLKVETRLQNELKEALEANNNLQEIIRSKNLEIASLKDQIRGLEESSETDSCVKNFGMGSNDDWREPGVQNAYNKRSNLNVASPYSALAYGDFSKTQSLPAMLLVESRAKGKEQINEQQNLRNVYESDSFTDVPLSHSFQSVSTVDHSSQMSDNSKDLVDLSTPMDQHYSSTSTLLQQSHYLHQPTLQPGLSTPNLSGRCNHSAFQNWGFIPRKMAASDIGERALGAKLVNGHLCWKGANNINAMNGHRDMSSICTEFDPLSDESPSCENFVDSLNLSIPLKPQVTISQLSSIGDSLHSASLDLGCSSNNGNQNNAKINIARSVDGIRDLFVDPTYCKRPLSISSQIGHSNVTPVRMGKSGRHMPVNLINCMHESSDYSLL